MTPKKGHASGMWFVALMMMASSVSLDDAPRFHEGIAAYDKLEFEESLLHFQRLSLEEISEDDQPRLWIWLGVLYGQTGDLAGAKTSFAKGLALNADLYLPVTISPKLDRIFNQEKQKALKIKNEALEKVRLSELAQSQSRFQTYAFVTYGVGAALLVVSAAASAISYANFAQASDPTLAPAPSQKALDQSNTATAVALGSGIAAFALFGAGSVLLFSE